MVNTGGLILDVGPPLGVRMRVGSATSDRHNASVEIDWTRWGSRIYYPVASPDSSGSSLIVFSQDLALNLRVRSPRYSQDIYGPEVRIMDDIW